MIESEKGSDIKIFALNSAHVAQSESGAKNLWDNRKNPKPKTKDGIAK